jgi:hypothetical protein
MARRPSVSANADRLPSLKPVVSSDPFPLPASLSVRSLPPGCRAGSGEEDHALIHGGSPAPEPFPQPGGEKQVASASATHAVTRRRLLAGTLATASAALVRRARRETQVVAAEAAHNAAIDALGEMGVLILDAPTRSLEGLAVKARVVKTWGKPDWWDPIEGRADTYERLAAEILDTVMAMAEVSRAGPHAS